jgi:hypothetical protein
MNLTNLDISYPIFCLNRHRRTRRTRCLNPDYYLYSTIQPVFQMTRMLWREKKVGTGTRLNSGPGAWKIDFFPYY